MTLPYLQKYRQAVHVGEARKIHIPISQLEPLAVWLSGVGEVYVFNVAVERLEKRGDGIITTILYR